MKRRSVALAMSLSLLWFAGCSEPSPSPLDAVTTFVQLPRTGADRTSPEFRLRLHHLHTGESIDVAYRRGDQVLSGGVGMLDHFLRDHRTGEDAHYPVSEFDLLHALAVRLGIPDHVIDIVCGYRSPWSNGYLRTRGKNTGVAEASQHVLSRAIDIRIPGVSTVQLRDAALSLRMGGVGYYPRSGFVHVDVGPVREWTFSGENRLLRSRGTAGHKPKRRTNS